MFDWLWKNKEWVFSGVGVAVIAGLVAWLRSSKQKIALKQTQRSGAHSTNLQAGGDINVGGGKGGR
jgi:hypothetical protein